MTDVKAVIANILRTDSTLLAMLPENTPYAGNATSKSKLYSVIPAGLAKGDTKTPFITIQAGPTSRIGKNQYQEVVYIRVYDDEENGTVRIAPMLARIKALLDYNNSEVDDGVNVEIRYESSLAEVRDEPIQKHFIEAQYRMFAL